MPKWLRPSMKAAMAILRYRFQDQAEQAVGAVEIPLPQGMAGIAGQRGIQHARNFRAGRSQCASASAVSWWRFSRTGRVRSPRSPRKHIVAAGVQAQIADGSGSAARHGFHWR